MSFFIVVLDTCVLFPSSLRDILLRTAEANLYRVYFTEDILEELRRNLMHQRGIAEDKAQRLIDNIKEAFPESLITHHRSLIPAMPINEKDRHVLAAAVASSAQVIVTQNLKDFPQGYLSSFGVEAQAPDEFLVHLFYLAPKQVINIIAMQAQDLQKPPKTVIELLDTLKQHAPNFVSLIRNYLSKSTSS
jgi:predicted nucleic acid-binding protein